MASSQLCFRAPKPGLCGGLSTSSSTSCRASNTVLVSNRLRPRSIAVSRRNENGVNMKAGNGIDIGIDGSTQKALVPAQVEIENPLQEEEEVNGSPSHSEPCPLQYATPAWSLVSILVGGDMLALLTFCAIGRLSHGLTVLDWDAFRTADPFIAGWLLGAYFLGGYGPDGRGANGFMKAVSVAVKSWAVGIPLGLIIKGVTTGKILAPAFILVSMGSTFLMAVGWRTLFNFLYPNGARRIKKRESYKQAVPLEF